MNNSRANPAKYKFKVAAFYAFSDLEDTVLDTLISRIYKNKKSLLGTILLGSEGLNGTVSGPESDVDGIIQILSSVIKTGRLELKISWVNKQAFRKFKARRKNEIVTMGVESINVKEDVGHYVEPIDWNDYLNDQETLIIDTRNEYEVGIGTFKNSVNPHTSNFREFPSWVDKKLPKIIKERKSKRIAMFCTGGIRCEKATSYLCKKGFEDVHHLHGGILSYLEQVSEKESLWEGECFVFDQRVSLNHSLEPGDHKLCFACGMPLDSKERSHRYYVKGVQCIYCKDTFTDDDRKRFAERQKHYDNLEKQLLNNQIKDEL